MTTTTIRIPDDLKQRVSRAAERAGTTAHGFILKAIAEKAEADEQRAALDELADQRYAANMASGKTIPWSTMRSYMEQRIAGEKAKLPTARKLAR